MAEIEDEQDPQPDDRTIEDFRGSIRENVHLSPLPVDVAADDQEQTVEYFRSKYLAS